MRSSRLFPLSLFLVSACWWDVAGPPRIPPAYSVSPLQQWSGGSVVVSSPFLSGKAALPVFVVDDDTLPAVRLDDSSAALTLPVRETGPVTVMSLYHRHADTVGTVQITGFAGRTILSPAPGGTFRQGRRGPDPVFFGVVYDPAHSYPTILVEPSLGRSTLIPEVAVSGLPMYWYYGAGITYRSDRFVFRGVGDTAVGVWEIWPTPAFVAPVTALNGSRSRIAQMTDSTWLVANPHTTSTYGPSGARILEVWVEDPWILTISPRHDRLAMDLITTTQLPGAPVFDTRTGDTAFTVPPLKTVYAADFAPDGSELYLLAAPRGDFGQDSLVVVDATDGSRRRSVGFSGLSPLTLTVDPGGALVYAHGYDGVNCGPVVYVYEAATLQQVGTMKGSDPASSCYNNGWQGSAAVDYRRNLLFILWNDGLMWTFDLLR